MSHIAHNRLFILIYTAYTLRSICQGSQPTHKPKITDRLSFPSYNVLYSCYQWNLFRHIPLAHLEPVVKVQEYLQSRMLSVWRTYVCACAFLLIAIHRRRWSHWTWTHNRFELKSHKYARTSMGGLRAGPYSEAVQKIVGKMHWFLEWPIYSYMYYTTPSCMSTLMESSSNLKVYIYIRIFILY